MTVPSVTKICIRISGLNVPPHGTKFGYMLLVRNTNILCLWWIANICSVVDVGAGILNKIKNMILLAANTM
jgi:hypothetical protein